MTERFLFTVAILTAVIFAGLLIRSLAAAWSARRRASVTLPGSGTAAARLLVFSVPFCGDCAVQRRVIDEHLPLWRESVEISYHDAAKESDLARSFGILSVPALVVAAPDGRIVGVRHGLVDGDGVRSLIAAAA